jgi:hypothetical protein
MKYDEEYLFLYIVEGPAAANIYDKFTNSQLVVDWSFDALYYKFNNSYSFNKWKHLTTIKYQISNLYLLTVEKPINL